MNTELAYYSLEDLRKQSWLSTRAVSVLKHTAEWILLLGMALASYFLISRFVFQSVQVVGVSMSPTLRDADHYFMNRWSYYFHPPQRGDIAVIKDPTDGLFVVKRIIAMPGESIFFKDGNVYVNGKKLAEPYTAGKFTSTCSPVVEQLILCGQNQYFVLGDNRDNSYDSRMYGPVRRESILGAVLH